MIENGLTEQFLLEQKKAAIKPLFCSSNMKYQTEYFIRLN